MLFEGMDGTGKTTQLQLANEALSAAGWQVVAVRGHGGTPIGEALRAVSLSITARPALTDLHISLAMHAALAEQVIIWRAAGKIILIDRGPLSIPAYQLYGDGLAPELVWPAVTSDLAQFNPELRLVYTAAVTTAMDRARHKLGGGSDYFESKGQDYFERINIGYQIVIERFKCTAIDCQDTSINEVSRLTLLAIYRALDATNSQA